MALPAGFAAILETLRQPNYGTYVAGNSISLIGTWMQRIGIGWLAWDLSHSGTVLGLVAFADLCPTLVLGPFGGALADRLDQRRMMLVTQSLIMALATILFLITVSGLVSVPLLLLLLGLNGALVGFNQPARLAMISRLVVPGHLATAVAINSLVFNLARFLGPALAGLVIAWLGVSWVFFLNSLSFVAFIVALLKLDLAALERPVGAGQSLWRDMLDGLRYTAAHPGIGPLLLLQVVMALCARPFAELLPGFAGAVFSRGAGGFAALSAAVGIGAVLGGVWLAQRRQRHDLPAVALLASGMLPLAVAGFALSPSFIGALASVTLAGIAMVIAGVGSQTLLQIGAEPSMRGRVLSLFGLIFRGGPALGALAMGVASEAIGLRLPVLAGAGLACLAWAWIWRRRQAIQTHLQPG